jgi:hypothetical protein
MTSFKVNDVKMEVSCIDVGATYDEHFVNIGGLCFVEPLNLIVCIAEEFN